MQAWQEQWERFNQHSAEPRRAAEVQQSRIQQLEQSLERLAERQRRLDDERALLAADPEDRAMLELDEQLTASELDLEALAAVAEELNERLEQLRDELQQATRPQQQAQGELQRLNGRIASSKPCCRRRWSRARGRRVVARRGWNSAHAWRMGYGSSRAGSWRWKPC